MLTQSLLDPQWRETKDKKRFLDITTSEEDWKRAENQGQNNQSLQSVTPSVDIWKRASASGKHGELITLQILSSALPFLNASLYYWYIHHKQYTHFANETLEKKTRLIICKHYRPCCGGMSHDIPTNRLKLWTSKKSRTIYLRNYLVRYNNSHTKLESH